MAALALLLVWVLVSTLSHGSTNPVVKKINAKLGEDTLLPCQINGSQNINAVSWSKTNQDGEQDVFLYRDGRIDNSEQHSSFKNRVELKHEKMENNNVSLVLRNISAGDKGRYECRVTLRQKSVFPDCIIDLNVASFVKNINAKLGEETLLPCQINGSQNISAVAWSKKNEDGEQDVFLYRDGHIVDSEQHSSFKNRVELKHEKMENNSVSLVLRNIFAGDKGTYECRVTLPQKSVIPDCIIDLNVASRSSAVSREPRPGSAGLIAALTILLCIR